MSNSQTIIDPNGNESSLATDYYGGILLAKRAGDLLGRIHTESAIPIQSGIVNYIADIDRFASVTDSGGTVTYDGYTGEYVVASAAASPSSAILIHNYIGHYRPNHQMSVTLTGSFQDIPTSSGQRIEFGCTSGIASDLLISDVIGFCADDSVSGTGVLSIFYRSSIPGGPDITTRQSDWNVDKLDGEGPSQYVFDTTSAQKLTYYEIKFVWLGGWAIQWSIGGFIVHLVKFSDPIYALSNSFVRNPQFRIFVWINNSSLATANSFNYNCSIMESIGGGEPNTATFSATRSSITIASGASAPIIGVRSLTTLGGISNGKRILPVSLAFSASQQSQISIYYGLVSDFTLTGASWTTPPNSVGTSAEIDIASTAITIGAGAWRIGGILVNTQSELFDLRPYFDEITRNIGIRGDGLQTAIYIVITNISTGNGTYVLCGLNWKEQG